MLTVLPSNFGYAIFTYLYSWIMLGYLAVKVGGARKKFDVKVDNITLNKENRLQSSVDANAFIGCVFLFCF